MRKIKVLATGCFDLLHSEHKKFLEEAKKRGDILLVGVESDSRVKQLKGLSRPVNPLKVRIKNLKELGIAEKVLALPEKFSTTTEHRALINQIKPDILAVSSHTPNLAAKKKIMKDLGGQMRVVLQYNQAVSTTKMLQSKQ